MRFFLSVPIVLQCSLVVLAITTIDTYAFQSPLLTNDEQQPEQQPLRPSSMMIRRNNNINNDNDNNKDMTPIVVNHHHHHHQHDDKHHHHIHNSTTTANEMMHQLQQWTQLDDNQNDNDKSVDRELQLDLGTILQVVDTACDLVGTLMLFDEETAVCDCTLTLSLEFGCTFYDTVCSGNFCSSPQVNGAFDLLQTRVSFTYCSNNATFNDANLPNFCVAVGGNLVLPGARTSSTNNNNNNSNNNNNVTNDETNMNQNDNDTKNRTSVVSEDGRFMDFLNRVQFLDMITVTVDGKTCRSASICNEGQGYIFDCTNINSQLIQSICTPIQTLTSLRQLPGTVAFLPKLDDPIPTPVPTMTPTTRVPTTTISPTITATYVSFTTLFNRFQELFGSLQDQQQSQNP